MNTQDHDLPPSDLPVAAPPGDAEPAPKPRRKRASAAPVAEAPGIEAVEAGVEAPAADEPAKPRRSRRKPVAATAAGEGAEAATTVAPAADESAPEAPAAKAPRPRRRAAAAGAEAAAATADASTSAAASAAPPAPAAEPMPAAEPKPAAEPMPAPPLPGAEAAAARRPAEPMVAEAVTPAAEPDAAAAAGEAVAPGAGEGEGVRKRNRNRRRGRRGGADKALREDGTAVDDGPVLVVTATPGDDDGDDDEAAPAAEAPPAAPLDAGETFAAVLAGDYDAEPSDAGAPAEPEKRVLAAEPDAPKLHKVLAQAGIGSRRDMEELIAEGQVMVNGQVAHTGQRISFGDRISVAGRQIKVRIAPPPPRIIAYHKPVGEVVTHDDPQHRPTVFRRLPRLPHGKWQSVGRLDINTEGLLLFTNSGELANQLMHPRFGVEREYAVRVLGTLEAEARARLLEGVDIDGQRASFKSIEDGGGEGVNHWYRVVITEGRNREVRKLFDKVGLGVSRLIRIRYGCVVLPRGLKRAAFVDLSEAEVREVRRLAGGGRDPGSAGPRAPRDGQGQAQGPNRGGNERRSGPPPQRADRGPATGKRGPDRPDRPERRDRAPRPPMLDGEIENENFAAIPNPLMQTFDKRAIREARAPRREIPEDGPIPNPLEQTYDKRFVQKSKGFGGGGGGGGGGRKGGGGGAGGGQPDPMKTSLGYIGADAFVRKFQGHGGGGGRRGGGGGRRGGGR
ncbi:MAG: rRNA pseudouridine synthase [Burkholderiaceae bacterium]|nr:rRNA pseudouridine synthase [Burkholderiaceae bacterium]